MSRFDLRTPLIEGLTDSVVRVQRLKRWLELDDMLPPEKRMSEEQRKMIADRIEHLELTVEKD